MKKYLALILALALVLALAACSNSTTGSNNTTTTTTTPAATETTTGTVEQGEANDEPEGGFAEIPIWEDEEIGFLNVSGVYFQPVPMSNGNENYEDYDMHFEADVSALPNDLGYGTGDWVPYMTVDFEIIGSDGSTAASGTFMPMNADDGPHYGANIKLPNADTYSVKLTFHNPEENGYLIHLDDTTGPGGNLSQYSWPLVLELDGVWDYVPQEW